MTAAHHHAAKGHAKKHATAKKHVHKATAKHNPPHHKPAHHVVKKAKVKTVGKHKAHAKGLAPVLGDVACCVSEALAASLRIAGAAVSDADVLALHRAAGAGDDRGAPIWVVLEAASEYGLAGVRLAWSESCDPITGPSRVGWSAARHQAAASPSVSLILGVDLPGQHTVLATAEGWWSWGELFCPWCEWPDLVVDEAWAVSWRLRSRSPVMRTVTT